MSIKLINAVKSKQGWDNDELAIALGVKIDSVWHWLASRKQPRATTKRILEFLEDFPELGPRLLRYGREKASRAPYDAGEAKRKDY